MKRVIALGVDAALIVLSVWFAFYLRLDEWVRLTGDARWQPQWAVAAALVIALPLFVVHGFYRMIFRYAGLAMLGMVTRAFALYGLLYAALVTAIGLPGVPRSIGILQPLLLFVLVGASRAAARWWLGGLYQQHLRQMNLPRVLIYGAGSAGRQLAQALAHSHELRVVGFLDDARHLHGQMINGLPVYAPDDLPALVGTLQISDVLLAMPSVSRARRNEILERVRRLHVAVRTMPGVSELAQGKVSVSDLRELDVDDLLGRDPVEPVTALLERNVRDQVVLVTGAGGSIGSELCRQIARLSPRRLLLFELSEYALYRIEAELRRLAPALECVPLLGSACDAERMRAILAAFRPQTIYHAAAYKHVPLVEHNVAAGIRNNALGTLTTARLAREVGVADFVLISTDKAVRPTNVMGASKRLAELILQALAAQGGGTRFSIVRFGNVLDSSGSVVPLFRRQIREGGPLTLTHPEVTRYFMTIPEAAQLVIQAGALAGEAHENGAVYVLDMGAPVKIAELAQRMIELSGLSVKDAEHPEGDIEIVITGLRPGEKLQEELLIGDNPKPTLHPRIMKAQEEFIPWAELKAKLTALEKALSVNDVGAIRMVMQQLVAGYTPSDDIVDWVYLEQEAEAGARRCGSRSQARC